MRQTLRYIGAGLARIYLLPLYWLSGFCTRRADIWVIGSWGGQRFADNAAAFFQYCQRGDVGPRQIIWISHRFAIVRQLRASGFAAHWWWSLPGMACCLRAGVHLFDCFPKDTNFWLSRGARLVNLWSGVPLKQFERDIDNPGSRYYRLFHGTAAERAFLSAMMPWHVVRPDLAIATSGEMAAVLSRAFDMPLDHVAVTGLPRNDRMLSPDTPASLPGAFADAARAGQRLFLYLPTYRDSGRAIADQDWSSLDSVLESANARLFVKLHPLDRSHPPVESRRVSRLERDCDVYDVLPQVSVLISDYSSVIWDFMLLRRPLILFVPDRDEFVASSRGLAFEPENLPGAIQCRSLDELAAAIGELAARGADDLPLSRPIDRFHAHLDAGSSARVLNELLRRFPVSDAGRPGLLETLRYKFRYNSMPRLLVNALKRLGITVLPYYLVRRRISGQGREPDRQGLSFRELGEADMALLAALPLVHAAEQEFRCRIRAGQRCFALVEHNAVLGFCWMDPHNASYPGERFALRDGEAYGFDIYTVPGRRGGNLAPLLNACFTEVLRREGIHTVYGVIDCMNRPSLNFARKIGSRPLRMNLYLRLFGLLEKSIVLRRFGPAPSDAENGAGESAVRPNRRTP